MATWSICEGDVLEELRAMPDASFDALLSDPPAGIAFMDAEWDDFRRARNVNDAGRENVFGRASSHGPEYGRGERDNFVAWMTEVMREALRVLRPGAQALVWAIPRTSHWTATAIEDAGLEIRDVLTHHFGSGFPKSLDLERAVSCVTCVMDGRHFASTLPKGDKAKSGDHVCATTPEGSRFEGFGSALKPGGEHWILCRKPLDGTYAENALAHGVGGLAIDACRVATDWSERPESWKRSGHSAKPDADKIAAPAGNGIECHPGGRWPPNVLLSHAVGCECVGARKVRSGTAHEPPKGDDMKRSVFGATKALGRTVTHGDGDGTETVDHYDCAPGCPVAAMDAQSGDLTSGQLLTHHKRSGEGQIGTFKIRERTGEPCNFGGDSGGASRFFPTFQPTGDDVEWFARFCYAAKASRFERELGCEHLPLKSAEDMVGGREEDSAAMNSPRTGAGRTSGAHNFHPTIKSIALTKWLASLVCPPPRADGQPRRMLTPFAGSGSECIGGLRAGFDEVVGIEREKDFVAIARARLTRWSEVPAHIEPEDVPSAARKSEPANDRQPSLFDLAAGAKK